ncbi:MAG: DNA primase [Elusimicrobiota bacterium]|jgi:DNA primase|nr:DNA primase [Elusimicrobiota bacterium]
MKDNIIEKIRYGADILELVREYVPSVKKAGRTYKACCPFHQEKTPSFTVSPDKGLFYCFGCQTGGDVFAFLMKIENLSFNEAARKLAQRAGIEWRQEESMSEDEKLRLRYYKIMDFARDFYHKQLMSPAGAAARNYIKSRNLTKETAQKFSLGYAAFEGLVQKSLAAGFAMEDLKKLGLAGMNAGTDYFKNRLIFPILNPRGEAVAFGGRVMGEGQPKYLNSPETPLFSKSRILYALNFAGPAIRKEGRVILLEGYMDVIAAHQAGVENCVAPLGTSFTPEHAKLLKRYTSEAVVVFDPDSAGINAAQRAALILTEAGLYVRVCTLPEELDPDEYITKYGAPAFRGAVAKGRDIINFQADVLLHNRAALTPQDKANIAQQLTETIQKQPDEIIRREWARMAADRLGVDADIMLAKIARNPSAPRVAATAAAALPPAIKAEAAPPAEAELIRLLLRWPRYIEVCKELESGHFKNQTIWRILKGAQQIRAQAPDAENIIPALKELLPQDGELIIKLSLEALPHIARPQDDIEAAVKAIQKAALATRLKALQQEIKQYPAGSVPVDLMKRQIELQKKIKL